MAHPRSGFTTRGFSPLPDAPSLTAPLSRRSFIRSLGMAGAGLLWPRLQQDDPPPEQPPPPPVTHWDGSPLGRILLNVMTVYEQPTWRARPTGYFYHWNDVVAVQQAVGGEGLYANNHTWLLTEHGYIYSSWVQPVADQSDNPVVPVGEGGLWGMVSVPITWSRSGPSDQADRRQRMYYSSVHRIMGVENDYYLIQEIFNTRYWIKAAHLRIISPEEIAPLSPQVPPGEKRIVITLGDQTLRAYEGEIEVFSARISSGLPDSPTPLGQFRVLDKRHSQRMTGGQGSGGYNLPGIPWICYFDRTWVATHGCYWHNDYGRRHSNGCVNLPPAAARWLFRWTTPAANYWDFRTVPADQPGTLIVVKW